jgi:hypothetical protein
VTLDELLAWKARNQKSVTAFLHDHRELSGIHFMPPGDGADACVEFCLKPEEDADEMAALVRDAFPGLPFRVEVLDPDRPPVT